MGQKYLQISYYMSFYSDVLGSKSPFLYVYDTHQCDLMRVQFNATTHTNTMPPLLFHTIKALMIKKKNRYY